MSTKSISKPKSSMKAVGPALIASPSTPGRLLRDRLRAEGELFRAFTSHTTLTGGGREQALRGYLEELLPRRYEVLSGGFALLDRNGSRRASQRQQDLLIVDTWKFPTLYRKGSTAIVLPESVRLIIESKSKINGKDDMNAALNQSAEGRAELGPMNTVPTILFGFEATSSAESLRRFVEDSLDVNGSGYRPADLPDMIVTVSGIVARRSVDVSQTHEYLIYKAGDEAEALIDLIAYVLEQAFDSQPLVAGAVPPEAAMISRLVSLLGYVSGTAPVPIRLTLPDGFGFAKISKKTKISTSTPPPSAV